jgi:outer membrane protein assembly factor BamB
MMAYETNHEGTEITEKKGPPMKRNLIPILSATLLASASHAAEPAGGKPAVPPPHPGEPAAHRELVAGMLSNPARIYAREHLEGPPRVEPAYVKPARTDHWELTLPKLHPAGADAVLTVAVRDGAVVNGYTLAPAADNFFHYTSTYRLELAGGKLTGSVRIRFLGKNHLNTGEYLSAGQERVVLFEARAAGETVSGTGEVLGEGATRRTIALTGTFHAGGRPPHAGDALAAGELWPGHRGPLASGAGLDKGHRLVDDMSQARPVWKTAEDLPDARAYSSSGGNVAPAQQDRSCVDWLRLAGAKSAPVVADGCVFFYTLIPSGDARWEAKDPRYSPAELDKAILRHAPHDWMPGALKPPASAAPSAPAAKPRDYPQRNMFCVGADDVIFCFDARTGATLWKTVYPGASANYGGSKGGPHLTPFVSDGKVVAMGSTERIYCLDAKTGREVWQSHTGWSATAKHKVLQDCLAKKEAFPVNRSLETALVVADGVVVCSDGRGKLYQHDGYDYTAGPGLIGLDAATGKRLWQTPEGAGNGRTPCRWRHKGKTYILTDGGSVLRKPDPKTGKFVDVPTTDGGRLRALDPKSGAFLWEIPCGPTGMCLVADEDHVIANTGDAKSGEISCFRIAPEKAEKLWSLPKQVQMPWGGYFYPVIYRGHVYFTSGGESSLVCVRLADGKVLGDVKEQGGGHTGGGHTLIAGEGRTFSSGICVTGVEENTKPLHAPWRVAFAIGYLTPLDPALADGRLFLRDKTGIVCYDLRKVIR